MSFFEEPGSFAGFYREHYPQLVRYFARRVREADQAMDLAAETFAAAYEGRLDFRGNDELQALAWVFAIAKSKLRDLYRDGAVQTAALTRLRFAWPAADEEELRRVEEMADAQAAGDELEAALGELRPAEREVVRRHILDGAGFAEIVGSSGDETPDAARMRLSRALSKLAGNRKLRRRLGKEADAREP